MNCKLKQTLSYGGITSIAMADYSKDTPKIEIARDEAQSILSEWVRISMWNFTGAEVVKMLETEVSRLTGNPRG